MTKRLDCSFWEPLEILVGYTLLLLLLTYTYVQLQARSLACSRSLFYLVSVPNSQTRFVSSLPFSLARNSCCRNNSGVSNVTKQKFPDIMSRASSLLSVCSLFSAKLRIAVHYVYYRRRIIFHELPLFYFLSDRCSSPGASAPFAPSSRVVDVIPYQDHPKDHKK